MFWKHPPPGGGGYGKIYTVIHIRYSNYRPFRLKPVTRCRMLCCVQVTAIVKSWRRCRFYLVIDRWITSAQHVQGFICMYWKYKILFRGGKYSIASLGLQGFVCLLPMMRFDIWCICCGSPTVNHRGSDSSKYSFSPQILLTFSLWINDPGVLINCLNVASSPSPIQLQHSQAKFIFFIIVSILKWGRTPNKYAKKNYLG